MYNSTLKRENNYLKADEVEGPAPVKPLLPLSPLLVALCRCSNGLKTNENKTI